MAAGELTDAEVFGQRELSDAEVFSRPATLNPNLAAQGARAEGVRDTMRTASEFMSQRDPGIDYRTGVNNAVFRAAFSRMTNEAERGQYLDRTVGKGEWGQDSFGAYFIKPGGLKRFGIQSDMPVSLDEQLTTRYDVADWAGDAPAMLGSLGFGMAASGAGFLPGVGMAALGAAGGKALDEIIKNVAGDQVKSAGEVAGEIGTEAGLAAVGEGAARTLAPVGRFLLGPAASRMTPEKEALAASATEQGFKIRPGSVTDAPILARWEGMVRSIFGDLHEKQNRSAAQAGLDRLGANAGPQVSKDAAGDAVKQSLRRQRVNFSGAMEARYKEIDDLVGGTPLVPTTPLKAQADAILAKMPKTTDGKVVGGKDGFIRDILKMGDFLTVTQAQRLRTMLREASESPDLIPDVSMHDARELKKAVEAAFESAKNAAPGSADATAIAKLRTVDASYAQGIRQFDKPVVNAIARDASRTGAVDADMVVDYLVKPERLVRLRQVKNVVEPQAWEKVKSAHAKELLSGVMRGTDDPLVNVFDGRAFRDTLDKYGREVLEEVHGRQWVDEAYKYANALMLAEKKMKLSGGIVAANIALHPIQNLPRLVWIRALAKVMEQPGTFKYLTEGFKLGPNTKEGAMVITRVLTQAAALAEDETGSARFTITEPPKP
jgi:hypothetical protein